MELKLAQMARDKILTAGGEVTFNEYDSLMYPERYFTPFNWIIGWGLPVGDKKRNNDKMCAFAACKHKLIEQTKTGYKVISNANKD